MTEPTVLKGINNWLFLREGTNRSLSYLTGTDPISDRMAAKWRRTIFQRQRLFPKCLHVICPEKLAVFPSQCEGITLDQKRLANQLASQNNVIYPLKELKEIESGFCSYSKTDTHFNDLGAIIVARNALSHFGIEEVDFSPEWTTIKIAGDLGVKQNPVVRSDKVILSNPLPVEQSSNGLNNRGRILYFSNAAALKKRILIFGDSFSGINLARMFANFLSEVLFVHSLSADFRVIKQFNPDFLLFELAERFLRDAPCDGTIYEKLLIDKALQGEGEKIFEWRAQTSNPTSQFVDWEIFDFATNGILNTICTPT